jgi:hypothetical protein
MAAELLPADRQMAVLLRKITLAGQQTGVQFTMFKPNPAHSETYYTELPMEISVYSGYHQVGSFLAELANMRRIVNTSNVHLTTNSHGDDAKATTSASLTASAYSPTDAAAPPAHDCPSALARPRPRRAHPTPRREQAMRGGILSTRPESVRGRRARWPRGSVSCDVGSGDDEARVPHRA